MARYRWLAVMVVGLAMTPAWALAQDEKPATAEDGSKDKEKEADEAKPAEEPKVLSPEEFAKRTEEMAKGLKLSIDGDIDPAIAETVGRLTALYYDSYPKLLARLDNPDRPAPRHITLHFRNDINVPAYCTGEDITISIPWITEHPEDIALLTHELTHAVQQYRRRVPGWFTEGLADYTRKIYGPADQPGWALPEKFGRRDSHESSYRITGRFLMWMDEKHPGAVDKLHRDAQTGEFEVENFEKYTGKTVKQLWDECAKELAQG